MNYSQEELRWISRPDKANPILQRRFGGFTKTKKYKWDLFGFFDIIDWTWGNWEDVPLTKEGELP